METRPSGRLPNSYLPELSVVVVPTGPDGSYEIPNLPDGEYTITVTYPDPTNPDKDITKDVC